MNVKSLLGFLYILLALYLVNLGFGFFEFAFIESKWILVAVAILMGFESITYFRSNREHLLNQIKKI